MDNAKNAQATPDGVLDNGKVTGYSVIIRALNDGEHDANTVKGFAFWPVSGKPSRTAGTA